MPTFSLRFSPLLIAFCLLPCLFMGRAGAQNPGGISTAPLEWLKADSITGVANGGNVTSWTAAAGVTPNAGTSPTFFTAAQNGLPVVHFAGGQYLYGAAPTSAAADYTVFVVASDGGNYNNNILFMYNGSGFQAFSNYNSTGHPGYQDGTGVHTFTPSTPVGYHIYHYNFNSGAGGTTSYYVDGLLTATGPYTAIGISGNFWVGGISGVFKGDEGEIIIEPGNLSAADQLTVETYLESRWGIASQAPVPATLAGPFYSNYGVASGNFTMTPSTSYTGTLTPTDGGAGGTFTPTTLSWSASVLAKTLTYTPAAKGMVGLTFTGNPPLLPLTTASTGHGSPSSTPYIYSALDPAVHNLIVCDGDSHINGNNGPVASTFPYQLQQSMGAGWNVVNGGINALTTGDMVASDTARIDPLYSSGNTNNILVIREDGNDLFFGASQATAYSHWTAEVGARKAAGWKVFTITDTPRNIYFAGTATAQDAIRQNIIALQRANWSSVGNAGLIDFGSDQRFGLLSQTSNTIYYQDQIHETALLWGYEACDTASVLSQYLSTGKPGTGGTKRKTQ